MIFIYIICWTIILAIICLIVSGTEFATFKKYNAGNMVCPKILYEYDNKYYTITAHQTHNMVVPNLYFKVWRVDSKHRFMICVDTFEKKWNTELLSDQEKKAFIVDVVKSYFDDDMDINENDNVFDKDFWKVS